MKTKLTIAILLGLLTIAFIFNNSAEKPASPPQPSIHDNEFMVGAMNSAWDYEYRYLPQLNVNIWHNYSEAVASTNSSSKGWFNIGTQVPLDNDRYDKDIGDYSQDIIDRIWLNRDTYNMRSLMDRPKIGYLAYGQRSDYQCEPQNYLDPEHQDYGFYTYSEHPTGNPEEDNTTYGGGARVMHCRYSTDQPGLVVSGLKANHEQANDQYGYMKGDYECNWYIMPRIRIDPSIVENYPETEICRIDILDWNGNPVQDYPNGKIIYAKYFAPINAPNQYTGDYRQEYYYNQTLNETPSAIEVPKYQICPTNPNKIFTEWPSDPGDPGYIHTDYRVYWYGYCDMWIDYVRVENEPAHQLFNGEWDDRIRQEVYQLALDGYQNQGYVPNNFYQEEMEFNCIPCIGYVNQIIQDEASQHGVDLSLMIDFNYALFKVHIPTTYWPGYDMTSAQLKRYIVDSGFVKSIALTSYPLAGYTEASGYQISHHPTTLTTEGYDPLEGRLSYPASPSDYDRMLQDQLDDEITSHDGFTKLLKLFDGVTKIAPDTRLISLCQNHSWWKNISGASLLKEPTNEELDVLANLVISYGAKGLLSYEYPSYNEYSNLQYGYSRGLTEPILTTGQYPVPRTLNAYDQNKWQQMCSINDRLKNKWGPTLMSFDNTNRHSYIYRDETERNSLIQNTYFRWIVTGKPGTAWEHCPDWDAPENEPFPPVVTGMNYDCKQNTYLQVATFENSEPNTYYFMIINRRCAPFIADEPGNNNGGRRRVKVIFDTDDPQMSAANNWKITEIGNDGVEPIIFDKNAFQYVDLDWYQPGEGKLYKMEPVVKSGGILVGNEDIQSGSFTCEGTVYTNGYNLTIEDGVTIHFTDTSKFVVHGGTFQMGNAQHSGPNTIVMDGDQGGSWKGFEFDTCSVKIYSVNFSDFANDSTSMLTMLDCPVIDIRSCSFDTESGTDQGVIDAEYSGSYGTTDNDNVYIGYNTFETGDNEIPAVKVMAYSGFTTPVIVEGNDFTGNTSAVFLSNIQGGAVKSNIFTDYGRSLTALSSSVDVFGNIISSGGLYGLEGLSGTELKMSYAGGMLVGGRNTITNSDTGSYNLYVEDSYFLMDEGENVFDIGPDSYHLYGWFPESYGGEYYETENCFKVQGNPVDPPNHYVTLGEQGYQITDFVFDPYLDGCMSGGGESMMAINLGNGIYDTVLIMGSGGSMKGEYVISPKSIYDSISISMRFRNYNNVKTLCTQLLNAYPDSPASIGAVSKLYLATAKTDTSLQGITDLKSLYEGLILNHPNNVTLVKRCNYFVQKCKVLLHQYSSALAGFQQIINQNQYNYEGLVARWDYMATSLLMQGQGGGESPPNLPEGEEAVGQRHAFDTDIYGDDGDGDPITKSPFTKEEKKQIKQTVRTALQISKTTEKKRIEVLTELSKKGDEKAAKQLKVKKALEQTVKTEKPKNIIEHMRIVTNDIKHVFVNPNEGKNKSNVFIPTVYDLSQNYPNPFNPKTKINYDIPKNSYVKLIVYDILGREVIKLVNNEFKQPGRYTVEFNGTNFASGVYFIRLEAGDYVKAKKMVLVK